MKRDGKCVTVEYARSEKSGPLAPPWDRMGYQSPYLVSVAKRGSSGLKVWLLVAATLGTAIAAVIMSRRERAEWRSWRGPVPGSAGRSILFGAAVGASIPVAIGVFFYFLTKLGVPTPKNDLLAGFDRTQLLMLFPAVVVVAPLAEELLFGKLVNGGQVEVTVSEDGEKLVIETKAAADAPPALLSPAR